MGRSPNSDAEQPVEHAIAELVTAPVGSVTIAVVANARDNVEIVAPQALDHLRCARRVVRGIAVGHDVDVRIDLGEHPAHDAALARPLFATHDRARIAGDVARAVAAAIVVDVDRAARQRRAKVGDDLGDRERFVVAGHEHRDRAGVTTSAPSCALNARAPGPGPAQVQPRRDDVARERVDDEAGEQHQRRLQRGERRPPRRRPARRRTARSCAG